MGETMDLVRRGRGWTLPRSHKCGRLLARGEWLLEGFRRGWDMWWACEVKEPVCILKT